MKQEESLGCRSKMQQRLICRWTRRSFHISSSAHWKKAAHINSVELLSSVLIAPKRLKTATNFKFGRHAPRDRADRMPEKLFSKGGDGIDTAFHRTYSCFTENVSYYSSTR